MQKATILIPDISGYTQFLTKTELSHSTHIVNELLQVVADSIQEEFKLVEIEGDALLTYADGYVDPSKLEQIAEKAFRNFHYFLKVIERDRVCRCGACQGASELSLKFIVHYGEFDEIKIAHLTKLTGPDMIIAHRLMKNEVPSKEYILMTDAYYDQDHLFKFEYEASSETYDLIGEVFYHYTDISFLREKVASPEKLEDISKDFGLARAINMTIEAPIDELYRVLTEQNEKLNYVEGLTGLTVPDQINRIGSTHICEFDGDSFDFKTVQSLADQEQIIYTEEATSATFGNTLLIYYELSKVSEEQTHLSVRMLTGDRQPLQGEMANEIYARNEYGLNMMKAYVEKLQAA